MPCDTPLLMYKAGEFRAGKVWNSDVHVPCGKCPPCKKRRVNDWVIRMKEEDKVSSSSFFITLTYDTKHVPITENGFMTLSKRDVQLFMKRLRKLQKGKIKYYAVGEYGTKTFRPHYHIIMFGLESERMVKTAWKEQGSIHIGNCSGASIAYTTKYIDKEKRIPLHKGDDRQKEFSLMSQGLGKSFLTEAKKKYYKEDQTRLYVKDESGVRRALPRYYREKIFTESERIAQNEYIKAQMEKKDSDEKQKFEKKLTGKEDEYYDFDHFKALSKQGRYNSFYKNQKSRE